MPRAMIAHCYREDEDARPFGFENLQYLVCQLRVGVIRRAPRAAEALETEKGLEAERRNGQIPTEKAAVERVQANGMVALIAQAPDERDA